MLEVGKTFVKNGNTFCLIQLLNYNGSNYAVFSVEDISKELSFCIYNVIENDNGYNLVRIDDTQLKCTLFEMIEKEGN